MKRVFYFKDRGIMPQDKICLGKREEHYLFNVLRSKPAEEIEVQTFKNLYIGKILSDRNILITKKINIEEIYIKLTLLQGIPKSNKRNYILEKGTEIGIDKFIFFKGENSTDFILNEKKEEKILNKIIESVRQCNRLTIPEFEFYKDFNDVLIKKLNHPLKQFFFLSPTANNNLNKFYIEKDINEIIFIIGPEKGLSANEIYKLKDFGIEGYNLGNNILRTETASIYCGSILKFLVSKKRIEL